MNAHDLLAKRTIIVTGAATGIGQAFALGCAAQGASVVVADLGPADETMAAIEAGGGRALYVRAPTSATTPRPARWRAKPCRASAASTAWSTTPPTSARSS